MGQSSNQIVFADESGDHRRARVSLCVLGWRTEHVLPNELRILRYRPAKAYTPAERTVLPR